MGVVAAPLWCACSADRVAAPPVPTAEAFVIEGNDVVVAVDQLPALTTSDRPVVLLAARIIVVRTGADAFRALSVECPHSGCAVSNIVGDRLVCPCHGSEFDTSGRRLAGPAPTGLTELATAFDRTTARLRVRRSA